jgi:hypothetical protein
MITRYFIWAELALGILHLFLVWYPYSIEIRISF